MTDFLPAFTPVIEAAAAAIANARAMRRGSPPIANVLEVLPAKLKAEVMEDAKAALDAAMDAAGSVFEQFKCRADSPI